MSFTIERGQPTERWADVYLTSLARGVSSCGDILAATALVLALQARGAGGGAVAALLIAAVAPPTLLAPLTGRLAHRANSRRLLVTVSLAESVVCAVLAVISPHAPLVVVIALAAALGCGLAISGPVLSALIPEMVRHENLARATALSQTANSV